MRVLVTGASGFIGSQVWPRLVAAGHDVICISRSAPAASVGAAAWIEADILQFEATAQLIRKIRPEILVHLAWNMDHGLFWSNACNLDWVAASLSLARVAAEAGARRIVATGTCFEYDWPEQGDCFETTTPVASHTLYDTSKSSLRLLLETWARQNEISFAWGRVFYLYGAGEHPARLAADVARHVVAGLPVLCSSGAVRRDFIDVRDAGAAIASLVLSHGTGSFNIGTGNAPTVAEVARKIGEIAGRPELVRIGARPDRAGEPPRIVADISRLRSELAFTPAISLEAGLADVVDYWRRQPSC